ncbi:poly-beta-1,6 N-acetyl-D-glucosamine export porin PgaA [Yersinia kristensenii]|uniref:Outer membrane protein n=1 Tax=Yersinia kristensenii TaxID=28152 RepID=A0A0T9LZX6_YERKR|nr:poly-beta-1,6 N-acetyl-D-glucosamine export porin PgaA [Yersinia kristensenii]MDA5474130.1 poly-beta-1,6 N-acetyl-D-glucosamine export porin PgaA [Yersinia kristensenii]MDA5478106.1 poly-beta-1,6 N-acetyl-D-glucosamine export porin PgaA [Yersinia kristensenii]MDA5505807.1 poly-beta-1,6 N-acetyl-D-glucosamine export porin PgaA [Yersinia kristensenii]MDA5522972.1 poly-beta-1,6 N-acetyl-D-glucosamine export porin PgaA [Yersinia kristensenii]NIK94694.1 poly-beta-1,6 N-acetyl-D-glucosamine expor
MYNAFTTLLRPLHRHRMTLLALLISGFSVNPVLADTQYDSLIIKARAGDTAPVLDYLQKESKAGPLNSGQVDDWLQIAGWAGRDQEVIAVYERYHSSINLSSRGLASAARAYRNEKRWDQALALWQSSLKKDPTNPDLITGMIMTQADSGRGGAALQQAKELADRNPSAQNYMTLSYLNRATNRNYDALQASSEAVRLAPESEEVLKNHLEILQRNRIADPALQLAKENPKLVTAGQYRQLERDAAAEQVRMAVLPTRSEAERFYIADKALADYQDLLARWSKEPEAQEDYQRARIDRLGALLVRRHTEELIKEYESMEAEGYKMPDYARRWAASAYIDRRMPEKAATILTSLYYADGKTFRNSDDVIDADDLYYALNESEQLDRAHQFAKNFSEQTPYQIGLYGLKGKEPNVDWVEAQTLYIQSLVALNDLPAAQKKLTDLSSTAPANQDLRIALASVYLARDWPRKAEQELKAVESLEPRSLILERAQAETAMDLQEWHQMELLTDDVIARSPEDVPSQELDRQRKVHNMYELRVSGNRTISSNSPVSGNKDYGFETLLYSRPIAENWRVFGGGSYNNGQFEEGTGINRVTRLGGEWTSRNIWVEGEVNNQNYGFGNKTGARLSTWYEFNDHWRVGGQVERLAKDTPLRAMKNNISANSASAYVFWKADDRRDAELSVTPSRFSDGNNRWEYELNGRQRIWTGPYLTADFNLGLAASTNTKEDVIYYNPKRDFTYLPAVTLNHIMYRHYKTIWSQQVQMGVGGYWEKKYGNGLVTTASYGQRVQWNDVVDTGVAVTYDKRPYDGAREHDLSLAFDLNYRF